jgi:hypothetical protein
MKLKTSQEKFVDYERLRVEAHRLVDTLTRKQLQRLIANFKRHLAALQTTQEERRDPDGPRREQQ